MVDAPRPDHAERLDPADLALLHHHAAQVQAAQSAHAQAQQRLALAQQAAQTAEREYLAVLDAQRRNITYLFDRYAIGRDQIGEDGAITRVESQRDGYLTEADREVIDARVDRILGEALG